MAQVNKSLLQIFRALWRDIETPKRQFDHGTYENFGETKKKGAQWGALYAAQLATTRDDMKLLISDLRQSGEESDQALLHELECGTEHPQNTRKS